MQKPTPAVEWAVWTSLGLVLAGFAGWFLLGQLKQRTLPAAPVLGQVVDFTLTNQASQRISMADLRGKVWIADIIFTRCPGPCLKMTRAMRDLQKEMGGEASVRWVTLTADPEFDTPAVLTRYGERVGADFGRWHFLHGARPALYDLATRGLLLAVQEKAPDTRESEADLFIHSTRFAVVDRQGRIRGMFDGTEASSVAGVRPLVEALLRER